MQRKRTVNSLLITMGVAIGLSFSVGKVSAAEISVDDVVPVIIVDQTPAGEELADDEDFVEEEQLEHEQLDEEAPVEGDDVQIGDAIAIERSADGTISEVDLSRDNEIDEVISETVEAEVGDTSNPTTTTSPTTSVVVSDNSVSVEEVIDAEGLHQISQHQDQPAKDYQTMGMAFVAVILIAIGLLVRCGHLLNGGSRV